MNDLRKRVARAICAARCASMGDPPCHTLDGYDGTDCDDVAGASCGHLADAVLAAVAAGPQPDLDLLRRDAEARQRGENLDGSTRWETVTIIEGAE